MPEFMTQKLMRQNKLSIVLRVNLEIVYYASLVGETDIQKMRSLQNFAESVNLPANGETGV